VAKFRVLCGKGKNRGRYPSFILACKLKALKIDLKNWNEEVFGNVVKQKKFFWTNSEVLILSQKKEYYLGSCLNEV